MIKQLNEQAAQNTLGGGGNADGYYYKCWNSKGGVYWDYQPNNAGCVDSRTGQTVRGSAPQRAK